MSGIRKAFRFVKKYALMFWERADIFLLVMCILCSLFGLVMIRSATAHYADSSHYIFVQLFSMALGIGAFVVLTFLDSDVLGDQWRILCVINVLLVLALIPFGKDDGTGNRAWLRFAGIGIQPSEIVKVLYIIVSAKQMTTLREYHDINSIWSVVQMAAHFAAVFGLIIVVSSDLGSSLILLFIFLVMFWVLGVKGYWFGLGGAAIAAAVPLLWNHFLKDYQRKRLIAPYAPDTVDPTGDGITWQTRQSKLTLASGRLTGNGLGFGTQTQKSTSFTGKHTDFIYSVVGEELGMIGCIAVIILLTIIIIHCVRVGLHAGRMYDTLICFGVAAAVTFQTFINIGMCIGITPVIGITLPFFSYGGSSMVTTFAAMGLVSGIKYKPKPQKFTMLY